MTFGGDTGIDADAQIIPQDRLTGQDFIEIFHKAYGSVSCGNCESEKVEVRGVNIDAYGFYLQLHCQECNTESEDGDGEFFDYYDISITSGKCTK